MRYSYDDLKSAVMRGDVARLQEILRNRDPATGHPYLDINNMPEDMSWNRNLLLFIFHHSDPHRYPREVIELTADSTREMVLSILAVRDHAGNPIINLNAGSIGVATAFETLFSEYKYLSTHNGYGYQANRQNFLTMVDALINTRNEMGDRVLDVDVVGHASPLLAAITLGDADLVSMLLDLRNADGSFAIDVNIPYSITTINRFNRSGFRSPLDAAYAGHDGGEPYDPVGFQPNARILQMLQDRGALRYAQLNAEQLAYYQAKDRRMNDELRRRDRAAVEGQVGIIQRAAPVPAVRPPVVADALVHAANFDRNKQNIHNPEVERTIDLSILQLKKTYALAKKPDFAAVQRDINTLIDAQVGGRLYDKEQIAHIQQGFSYVCNQKDSLHAKSNLRLPEIMTLIWLGIHDKSKMPNDFPLGGDKDLFVKVRRAALLDKFLAIATTYEKEGKFTPSCLGGTRNLIVEALNKAHPDVSIAPTPGEVKELGLEQAKRFMLDELKKLPIREQRAILRTWNDESDDKKTPATKFRESVKPLLDAELTEKLGSILPADFFPKFNEQYEFFPEPVVHRELADFCKKIRELPDDLFDAARAYKLTVKNEFIFSDTEESFDDEYQKLKSKSGPLLRLFENKLKLDQLIADVRKYNKDKSESFFSKNDIKSEGAQTLLQFLDTLKNLNPVEINTALTQIEKILGSDEKKYFGLKFDTWFFAKERQSELKSYYERAQTILTEIIGDQKVVVAALVAGK